MFSELCELCLWGNATDLSLLTNLTYNDVQALQGSEARKSAEKNILVNDVGDAYKALKLARDRKADITKRRRVDIALDNAGFELYVDLVFAGYLLAAGFATEIVIHPKEMPWFVSDATPTDFEALLQALAEPSTSFSSESSNRKSEIENMGLSNNDIDVLLFLSRHLNALRDEGKIKLQKSSFWHQPGSHLRLPRAAPRLFEDLKQSELVIFKGDLHYRKLTADVSYRAPADPTSASTSTHAFACADCHTFIGNVASNNAFCGSSRSIRGWFGDSGSCTSHLQGGCRCWSKGGNG